VTYEQFVEAAHSMWDDVPARYRAGVDGLVVRREAEAHPDHDDYFTMGTCHTEPYLSGYGGPDSTRSILTLFYGSFRSVSASDPDFSWEGELRETITHELRHHLEFLVEDETLDRVDYAMEQAHRRGKGLDFDPWYFRSGLRVGPDVYSIEQDLYLEQRWESGDFAAQERLAFELEGRWWAIPRPSDLGDVHFVSVALAARTQETVQLVLVKETPLWDRIRHFRKRRPLHVLETESNAVVVDGSLRS